MTAVRTLVIPVALVALLGCAHRDSASTTSSSSSSAQAQPQNPAQDSAQAASTTPIPKGHVFEKVKYDMTDAQVKQILGAPTSTQAYVSGKTFIPYYYGTEGSREAWSYKGKGQIVFSRNRWNGNLTVIEVVYDPKQQ